MLQHEMFDQFGFAYLITMITVWNNKKDNILHKASREIYLYYNNQIFDYEPVVENIYDNYEEDVQNEKEYLLSEEAKGSLVCSGAIFVGYLVAVDGNDNPIPYWYKNLMMPLISYTSESLTSIPVYLKRNGWFTTGEIYIDCNPLKKRGSNSCWELQMHYDEKGSPCGFYFTTFNYAAMRDGHNYLTCTGPLSEIVVTKNEKGDIKFIDNNDKKKNKKLQNKKQKTGGGKTKKKQRKNKIHTKKRM